MTEDEEFEACTRVREAKCGCTEIKCVHELWSVMANSKSDAMREAKYYFRQYRSDGEYSELIGGMSVVDNILRGVLAP